MNWLDRSATNLLPLSTEKADFYKALKEWVYSGDMYDLEKPSETCELCEHPDLRYQFRVVNTQTAAELLVGSECINKFGIVAVTEDGRVLSVDESRRKVNKDRRYLVTEAKKRSMVGSLVRLAGKDSKFDIQNFLDYLQDRGAFTPNQLSLLIWRLKKNDIDFTESHFKLTIRRNREKSQLLQMPDWKIKQIWGAMTTSQRKWYNDNQS